MVEIKDDAAVRRLNDGDMLVVEGYIIEGYTIVESWEPPKDDGTRWIVEGIDETSWVKNVPPSFVRQLNSEGLFGKERPTALEVAGVRLSWADAELQRYFTTTCNEQTRRMVLDFFTETQVDQSNCFFVDQTGAGELRLIDAATGDVARELPHEDTKINISQPGCVSFRPTGDATFASQMYTCRRSLFLVETILNELEGLGTETEDKVTNVVRVLRGRREEPTALFV